MSESESENRVGQYARRVGEILGLEPETLDMLELAGSLHDVGKDMLSQRIIDATPSLRRQVRDTAPDVPGLELQHLRITSEICGDLHDVLWIELLKSPAGRDVQGVAHVQQRRAQFLRLGMRHIDQPTAAKIFGTMTSPTRPMPT